MEFNRLLQIRRIYAQPAALELPRGQEIVARWPDADVVHVDNHWNIPELHGDETNVPSTANFGSTTSAKTATDRRRSRPYSFAFPAAARLRAA